MHRWPKPSTFSNRSKWFHGLAANTTWDLHLTVALGVTLSVVPIIFALTMTIIGIGRCSMSHSSVFVKNYMQWLSRDPESSTLANGLLTFYFVLFFPLKNEWSREQNSLWENSTFLELFPIFCLFYLNFSGVHHKKKNCESNQVISKVQQVLRIATKSHQLYPKSLKLTVASVVKKSKLRKGNGGWSDVRDHNLCLNVTWASNWYDIWIPDGDYFKKTFFFGEEEKKQE